MIEQSTLKELYNTISQDLSIHRFQNENEIDYKYRLVYSALGRWILSLFSDKEFEDEEINIVSKSHVTTTAINLLNSFKLLDKDLNNYFLDDEKTISMIEEVYLRLGYINESKYYFKEQKNLINLSISNKNLLINNEVKSSIKVRGLGLWSKPENIEINLENFLIIKDSASEYTLNLIKQLKFSKFVYNGGKLELYNIEQYRRNLFSNDFLKKYNYFLLKIDDGFDYQILQNINGTFYSASIPSIYSKKDWDKNFKHDIWRVILGICALNKHPAKCYLKIRDDFVLLKLSGFILPTFENNIVKCMAWPLKNSLNLTEFITDVNMIDGLKTILLKLSIEVLEE